MTAETDLLARVVALEEGARFDATKEEVHRVQADCLGQMREIRKAMVEGGTSAGSSKELEALKLENEKLKKVVSKQSYRISHLVGVVEESLEKEK